MNRITLILLSVGAAAVVIGGAAWFRYTHPTPVVKGPESQAATAPASKAASTRATVAAKAPATQLLDAIRADHPRYPTTQALDESVDLKYAARIVLNDPVYLDQQGHLWITRADGPERLDFAKAIASPSSTHVIRDRVAFVLWSPNEAGFWLPNLIVHSAEGRGYDLLNADGRRHLEDSLGFHFDRALVLFGGRGGKDRIVVPTDTGACAFSFDQSPEQIVKSHHALIDSAKQAPRDFSIQLIMDLRGVIAWVTDASGKKGAMGVARLAPVAPGGGNAGTETEYRWANLTGTVGWPDNILHLVPLLDGSVLQIVSGDEAEKVSFSINTVEAGAVDKETVLKLVDQLSDADQDKREEAYKKLTQYGPGIGPILEKSMEDQSPEARVRIGQLLKNRIEPTLGGMSLIDSKMQLMERFVDGGVLFYSEAGVSIPRPDEQPLYVTPAWLSIRPGRAVELMPESLAAEIHPGKQRVAAWGNNYVVTALIEGPQWFLGNRLQPLLRKSAGWFGVFAGIDAGGRWVFKEGTEARRHEGTEGEGAKDEGGRMKDEGEKRSEKREAGSEKGSKEEAEKHRLAADATTQSAIPSALSTQHSTRPSQLAVTSTLILDPRLPDVTPRMPVWMLPISSGKAGWDGHGWPVIYMDAQPKAVPWALQEYNWRPIDESKEKVFTSRADVPLPGAQGSAATMPNATKPVEQSMTRAAASGPVGSSTRASSAATQSLATTQATGASSVGAEDGDGGPLLLVDGEGRRYFGGKQALVVVRADGSRVTWTLPDKAAGTGNVWLVGTKDGMLYLFNEPGRVVRIAPVKDGPEPFEVQAVFTRSIPNDANPVRVWADPAGRICIVHNENQVTVLFPDGRIPHAIAEKMPVEQTKVEE